MSGERAVAGPRWQARLPLVDGLAGLFVGVAMLLARGFLAEFYGVSLTVVTGVGVANVLYSLGGLSFTASTARPPALLYALIAANLVWACVCTGLLLSLHDGATVFGLLHLGGEGTFVTALAALEWRYRDVILGRTVAAN